MAAVLGSDLPQTTRQALVELLFRTYPLYVDRPSRRAVQQCLRSLLSAPVHAEEVKQLSQRLQVESSRSGLAPESAFVLVEWCTILLQLLRDDTAVPLTNVLDIIAAHARALEICLAGKPKPSVIQSAVRVTRRALRAVFSSEVRGADAVRESVARLTSDSASGQKNAPFLGVICGVCARLATRRPVLEECRKSILVFYVKELVGSRTPPPQHIAHGLSDFFASFVTYDDIVAELLPPLEKAILRAPEVVLSGLIPALCSSVPETIDLSEVVYSRLLKHLLSSMKSNNAKIRQGAAESFEALLSRCRTESWLFKIATEVVGPLKTQKITSAEQRAVFAQVLCAMPAFVDLSREIVQALVPAFAKESNEIALEHELNAFCKHLRLLIRSRIKPSDEVLSAIAKGSSDKKIPFRKLWQLQVGEVLWDAELSDLSAPEIESLVGKFMGKMKDLFNEVAANPLPSAQSGALSTAYTFAALSQRLASVSESQKPVWNDAVSQMMQLSPKPSFCLNPRAYSKLTGQAEVLWAVRALTAAAATPTFESADHAVKNAWAQAFIYAITCAGLPTNIREAASRSLSEVCLRNPASLGITVVNALWSWILSFRTSEKESAATSAGPGSVHHLHLVLRAVCPPASDLSDPDEALPTLRLLLVRVLVLARTELIPNASWISLCLRTGVDPGSLVTEHADQCMNEITSVLNVGRSHMFCWPVHGRFVSACELTRN